MMNQQAESVGLSSHRAFVVQLNKVVPLAADQISGRVEHIVSGQATHFDSVAQLLGFMQQVLDDPVRRISECNVS